MESIGGGWVVKPSREAWGLSLSISLCWLPPRCRQTIHHRGGRESCFSRHGSLISASSLGIAKPASKVAKKESSADDDSSEESSGSDEENDQSVSVKKSAQNEPKAPASSSQATTVSKTVFVGNLSYNVDKEQVKQFFKEAGEIIDIRVAAFEYGKSKGFAHVEFATTEAAQKACKLNGHGLMGRSVRLNFAQERGAFTPGSGRDNNSFKNPGQSSNSTAFIIGFDSSLGEDQVIRSAKHFFSWYLSDKLINVGFPQTLV
ncbi:nucleolin 2-like [Lolium rigidum]|uniref:nucleolin 2-like n=1 Tax=Lolium rigidum TaxID=89674 RepID=UPI001F5CA309|nr:nucleolin 2-like [Lolium rigidum]